MKHSDEMCSLGEIRLGSMPIRLNELKLVLLELCSSLSLSMRPSWWHRIPLHDIIKGMLSQNDNVRGKEI